MALRRQGTESDFYAVKGVGIDIYIEVVKIRSHAVLYTLSDVGELLQPPYSTLRNRSRWEDREYESQFTLKFPHLVFITSKFTWLSVK